MAGINPRWHDLHVLLVSPDRQLVALLQGMLQVLGTRWRVGTSLSALQSEHAMGVAVAVVDCSGGIDGFGAPAYRFPLPVVAIIDPEHPTQAEQVLQAGAGAILTEPLSESSLRFALMTVLAQRPTATSTSDDGDIAIRKTRVQAAAERRAQELATLREVSTSVAAQRDIGTICSVAVEQLATRFGYDLVSIYLREGKVLRLQAQHGYDAVLDPLPLDGPEGVAARTVRLASPQFLADVRADPQFLGAVPGIVSEICVPIMTGERVAGIINVETRRPGLLDAQTQELLLLLAGEVASVLQIAQLYIDSRRHMRETAWLQRVTRELVNCETAEDVIEHAANSMRQGLALDRVAISLLDDESQMLHERVRIGGQDSVPLGVQRSLSLATGSSAWQYQPLRSVLRDGEDYTISRHTWEQCPEPVHAWLGEPVDERLFVALRAARAGDDDMATLGIVVADNRVTGRPLDTASLSMMVAFAGQVALAIVRARLLAIERRRTRIAEALARATAVISFSLDADDIYAQMLDLLRDVVEFDSATLLHIENGIALPFRKGNPRYDPFMDGSCEFPVATDPIFSGWIEDERRTPELIPDTELDPRWQHLGSGNDRYMHDIRCYLGAPLIVDGVLVGALCLGNRVPHSLDAIAVAATAEFAERLSHALRNAQLFDTERAAHSHLQSLVLLQEDFVATVSHEIRTPLTSILGFSELLLTAWDRMDDARRFGNVEKIQRSATRLDKLVREFLYLSRIDASGEQPLLQQQALAPLMQHAVEELAIKFPGQRVELDGSIDRATVQADADRLRQVVNNLLDNAAKYSPEGAPILVTWSAAEHDGILAVHDQGPGIQAENVARLFRRFAKLDAVTRSGHIGTGLGLYICKQLVESMNGQIWYQPGPGAGSTFCVQLPLPTIAP